MSEDLTAIVRRAASAAGDTSGNCDSAAHYAESGNLTAAALELEWAEENLRSAKHRIDEARAAVANGLGVPR